MDRRDFLKSGMLAAFLGPRDVAPPGGREVALPQLRTTIGGNCDANGNLTIKSIQPSPHFYAVFTLIAQVSSGAPQWVLSAEGVPLGFAGGGKATIGAIYTNPGERMQLVVTGAAPNAVVTGSLFGFFATAPEDLPTLGTISGGSGLGALPGGQLVVQGNLLKTNDTLAIACGGASYVAFSLIAGAALASGSTLLVQGTPDDQDWIGAPWYVQASFGGAFPILAWTTGTIAGPVGTAQPTLLVATAGFSQVRLVLSSSNQGVSPMTWIARAVPGAGASPSIGQQLSFNSQPVVIASDQAAFPQTQSPYTAQLPTYFVSAGSVSKAIGAGTEEQLLVLYHPATVAEQWKLRRLFLTIESNSVATILRPALRRLDGATAPSGGTAITVIAADGADAGLSGSDVFQTYPSTKGTTGVAYEVASWSLAISAAPTDVSKVGLVELYRYLPGPDSKPLRVRSATAEGWVLALFSSAASTVVASVTAEFTVG